MTRSIIAAIHIVLGSFLIIGVCAGAERAATIEYEFIERPAGVQADFVAPPNTRLRFLAIQAIDGFRVEAAQHRPAADGCSATPAHALAFRRANSQKKARGRQGHGVGIHRPCFWEPRCLITR